MDSGGSNNVVGDGSAGRWAFGDNRQTFPALQCYSVHRIERRDNQAHFFKHPGFVYEEIQRHGERDNGRNNWAHHRGVQFGQDGVAADSVEVPLHLQHERRVEGHPRDMHWVAQVCAAEGGCRQALVP